MAASSAVKFVFKEHNLVRLIKSDQINCVNAFVIDDLGKGFKKKENKMVSGSLPTLSYLTSLSKDLQKINEQYYGAHIQLNITILSM